MVRPIYANNQQAIQGFTNNLDQYYRQKSREMQSRVVDAEECRHALECTTWDHYALVLEALASGYRAAGRAEDAARVHATAVGFSPWLWPDEAE